MDASKTKSEDMQDLLKKISHRDFLHMGKDQIAYVRSIALEDSTSGYAVHGADGQQLSIIDSFPSAIALIRQNDMVPVTLH